MIPVYNEEGLLEQAIKELVAVLDPPDSTCDDPLATNAGQPTPCAYDCADLQREYFPEPQSQTTRCFLFDPATETWPEVGGQGAELLSMRQQRFETHTYIGREAGTNPPSSGLSFTMGEGRVCWDVTIKTMMGMESHEETVCLVDGEHEYNHTVAEEHSVEVVGYADEGAARIARLPLQEGLEHRAGQRAAVPARPFAAQQFLEGAVVLLAIDRRLLSSLNLSESPRILGLVAPLLGLFLVEERLMKSFHFAYFDAGRDTLQTCCNFIMSMPTVLRRQAPPLHEALLRPLSKSSFEQSILFGLDRRLQDAALAIPDLLVLLRVTEQ